jgi:hypothetical protein
MLQTAESVLSVGTEDWGVGQMLMKAGRDAADDGEAAAEAALLHPSPVEVAMLGHEGISSVLGE